MDKETFASLKPIVWLMVGGLLMSVASIIIWFNANKGHDGFAIGRITAVASSSIVVADPFEKNTRVYITETTRIEDAGQPRVSADLTESMFIQVSGTPTDNKAIIAEVILVTEPPHKNR